MSNYKMTVEASTIEELSGRLLALGAALAAGGDPVMPEIRVQGTTAPATTRTRKKKDAEQAPTEQPTGEGNEAAPTADAASETAAEASPPAAEAAKLDVVKDIQPLVMALNKNKGRDAVVAVLQKFGVERVTQLDAARLPELKTALEEATK